MKGLPGTGGPGKAGWKRREGDPPCLGLRKDILTDLHHEVTAGRELSHEAGMAGGLEAGEEGKQERMPCAAHGLKDSLLTVQTARGGRGFHRQGGNPEGKADLPTGCALSPTQLPRVTGFKTARRVE